MIEWIMWQFFTRMFPTQLHCTEQFFKIIIVSSTIREWFFKVVSEILIPLERLLSDWLWTLENCDRTPLQFLLTVTQISQSM